MFTPHSSFDGDCAEGFGARALHIAQHGEDPTAATSAGDHVLHARFRHSDGLPMEGHRFAVTWMAGAARPAARDLP